MGDQLTPAQVDAILRDAASRIATVVEGFTKVYQGSAGETVWNGSEELPTLAKLLTGFADRLAVIGIDGLVDRGIFELGQDYALLDAAKPTADGDYYVCTEAVTDATLAQSDDAVHWTPLAQFAGNLKAEADPLQDLGTHSGGGAPAFARLASAAAFGEKIDVLRLIPNVNGNHRKILTGKIGDQEDFTAFIKAGTDWVVQHATGGSAPTIVMRPGNWYVSGPVLHSNGKAVGIVGAGSSATNFQLKPEFNGILITLEALGFGPTVQRAAGTILPYLLKSGTMLGGFHITGDHSGAGAQHGIVTYGTVDEFLIRDLFGKYLRSSFLRLGDFRMDGTTQITNGAFRESALFNVGCHNCGVDGSPSVYIRTRDRLGNGDGSNQVDIYKMKLAYPAGNGALLEIDNRHASRVLRRIVFFGLQAHGSYQLGTTPDDSNYFDRGQHLVRIRGNCDGIRFYGWRSNGGGPTNASYNLSIEPAADPSASQGIAQNISVQGDISNTDFGVLVQQGKNITFDLNNAAGVEQVRVAPAVGGPGVQGKLIFRQPATDIAKVFIDPAVRANVDLYEDFYSVNNPIASVALTGVSSILGTNPSTALFSFAVVGNTQPGVMTTNYLTGTGTGGIRQRKAQGTNTAPAAVAANTQLARWQAQSHDSGGFNTVAEARDVSSEAHTTTAHGTRKEWHVVANGTTTLVEGMRLSATALMVGTTSDDGVAGLALLRPLRHLGYTYATRPTVGVSNGSETYIHNVLKPGDTPGAGTGAPVYYSSSPTPGWYSYRTDTLATT